LVNQPSRGDQIAQQANLCMARCDFFAFIIQLLDDLSSSSIFVLNSFTCLLTVCSLTCESSTIPLLSLLFFLELTTRRSSTMRDLEVSLPTRGIDEPASAASAGLTVF
jgi:hypothetical protein